jgi:hypothetical protein
VRHQLLLTELTKTAHLCDRASTRVSFILCDLHQPGQLATATIPIAKTNTKRGTSHGDRTIEDVSTDAFLLIPLNICRIQNGGGYRGDDQPNERRLACGASRVEPCS